MKMLNNYVLVKSKEEDLEQTQSGLFIPTKAKTYKVVEVVEPDNENEIDKGSVLYVPISSGVEVEIKREGYLIINKREIILIL